MKIYSNNKLVVLALSVVVLLSSCRENEFGTVDLSDYDPTPNTEIVFQHPCALYTQSDFSRVRKALEDGTAPAPVKQEFEALKKNVYTNAPYGEVTHAHKQLVRGTNAYGKTASELKGWSVLVEEKQTCDDASRDATAAYQFGILWQLTGDVEYAKKGVKILDAWASTCEEVHLYDPNGYLTAGAQGFTFALAGELLRTYTGWSESKFTEYKNWMKDVIAPANAGMLKHDGDKNEWKHSWSNWDLVNMCSYLQIGILCEDSHMVNYITEYFLNNGRGNGMIDNLVLAEHTDPLGTGELIAQNQESGRDQGHAMMSAVVAAQLAQAAWALHESNPNVEELDFYSAKDYKLLKMFEYVALTNLTDGTTFIKPSGSGGYSQAGSFIISETMINNYAWTTVGPWCTGPASHEASTPDTQFANDASRGSIRPGWETIYQHYRKFPATGTGTTYVKKFADKLRPEGGTGDPRYGSNSGAFDQIGWGTLMMYQE